MFSSIFGWINVVRVIIAVRVSFILVVIHITLSPANVILDVYQINM